MLVTALEVKMDDSKRRACQFLEQEIQTYQALALFLTKTRTEKHLRTNGQGPLLSPAFYKERMKQAQQVVNELRKSG